MAPSRLVPLVAALVLGLAGAAHAQGPVPLPHALAPRFESWRAPALNQDGEPAVHRMVTAPRNRGRRALVGGAIGAAAGVVFCTAMSTLIDDSANGGLSFCPLDSYLLIGGGGFLLGAAIGLLT